MQVDEQPVKEEKQVGEVGDQGKDTKAEGNKEPLSVQNFSRLLPEELAHLKTSKGTNGATVFEPVYKNGGMRRALGVTVVHKVNNDTQSFIQLNDNIEGKGKDNEVLASASIETPKDDMDMVD